MYRVVFSIIPSLSGYFGQFLSYGCEEIREDFTPVIIAMNLSHSIYKGVGTIFRNA